MIQRDKMLKLALKIQKILMTQPDRIMPLHDLGRFRKALGLEKRRRFIDLLKRFPAVFEIVEEGVYSLRFKLTPKAERLYLEEMRIRKFCPFRRVFKCSAWLKWAQGNRRWRRLLGRVGGVRLKLLSWLSSSDEDDDIEGGECFKLAGGGGGGFVTEGAFGKIPAEGGSGVFRRRLH